MTDRNGNFINNKDNYQISLIASGSELSLAKEVQDRLSNDKIISNLVSFPCMELFEQQSKNYKKNVLGIKPRVFIEASSSFGIHKFLRDTDLSISLDKFGESGKGNDLFKFFGFESNKIKKKIIRSFFSDHT